MRARVSWLGEAGHGGVRVPGGLPRLQSGCRQRSCRGGFDSRPPPLRSARRARPPPGLPSDGEQVVSTRVAARVAQLGDGPGLDLADPLPGEVEVAPDLLEGAGLPAVEAEAETDDLALAVV